MEIEKNNKTPLVGVIMGSDSDLPTMSQACAILDEFNIEYECSIVSAHRTPDKMYNYSKTAQERGIKVIIAGAGGAAHLPGMVASLTPLPVIGVPVKSSTLNGQDSLLSIVQMPKGIPVATVAIGNAYNAGLLALRILGINDINIQNNMNTFMKEQELSVIKKDNDLKTDWKCYLDNMSKF
tara:strand:- start:6276 stop:6818 length:543 start_codon:yes stop_codon:yes gene_type:complete